MSSEMDGALDRSDDEEEIVEKRGDDDEDINEDEDGSISSSDAGSEEEAEEEESVADDEVQAEPDDATTKQKQRLGLMEDDDDDDSNGDSYLKKFDASLRYTMMEQYHPELLMENNVDVLNKTVIQRQEDGTILDPLHRTLPLLTKYEKARILGERAQQLNAGAKAMVDVPDHVIDGYLIALQEYEAKKIPFIIKRPLCNGECEYWKFCDLECLL